MNGIAYYFRAFAGFLAAIGFTMSLFISGLAFVSPEYIVQANLGILSASVTASVIGYFFDQRSRRSNLGDS